jgi:DNA repair exonuclease SbcCD ATPase subunit
MTVRNLGTRTVGATVPLFATSLDTLRSAIERALADLQGDAEALKSDALGLEADMNALKDELSNVEGLAASILEQLKAGPERFIKGVEAAIAAMMDGSALEALKQALAAGPAIILASLQAALDEVTGKIEGLQRRITAIADRIRRLAERVAALMARIAALKALLDQLLGWQSMLLTSGVSALAYDGQLGSLGAEVGSEAQNLGGSQDHANALVLVASAPDPWRVLGKVFGLA